MLVQKTSQIIYEDMIFTSDAICCNTNSWLNFLEYGINNKGNVIVIYSHICPEVLFVMLASLSSEYIYLPIDIEIPLARVNKILSQVNVRVIITEKEYINAFEKYETCDINKKLKVSNERLFKNQLGKGNAYILFTSGSTGVPKGVLVSKYALERFINGTCKAISFSNIKSIICITSISFDIFFMESIFALMMGWKVFLASYIERRSPRIILKMIEICSK